MTIISSQRFEKVIKSQIQTKSIECAMTFRMIVQLLNTNTPVIVSRDAGLT